MRNNPEPIKHVKSFGERVRHHLDNGGWLEGRWDYNENGEVRDTKQIEFHRFGRWWHLEVDPEPQNLKFHYTKHIAEVKMNWPGEYNKEGAAHIANLRKTQVFYIAPYLLEMFSRTAPPMFDEVLKPPFGRITFPFRLSGLPTKLEEKKLDATFPVNYAYPTFHFESGMERPTFYLVDGSAAFLITDKTTDSLVGYLEKSGMQAVQIYQDIWANLCAALYCKTFLRTDINGGRSGRRHTDFNGIVEPLPYSILDLKPEAKKKYLPSLEMPVLGSEKRIVRAHWVRGHWAKYYTRDGPLMKFRPPFTRGLGYIHKKKVYFAKGAAVVAVGSA